MFDGQPLPSNCLQYCLATFSVKMCCDFIGLASLDSGTGRQDFGTTTIFLTCIVMLYRTPLLMATRQPPLSLRSGRGKDSSPTAHLFQSTRTSCRESDYGLHKAWCLGSAGRFHLSVVQLDLSQSVAGVDFAYAAAVCHLQYSVAGCET